MMQYQSIVIQLSILYNNILEFMGNSCSRQQYFMFCYREDENLIKKDILKFIKQFNQQIWYHSFQKILNQLEFTQNQFKKYNHPKQTHYDLANLNQQQSIEKNTNKFQNYNADQKLIALKQLIDKSYMVLDQEELPQCKQLLNYSIQKNLNIQQNYISSVMSILSIHESEQSREKKFQRLKNYDVDIIKSFDRFVNFCTEIKQNSQTQTHFICRLLLNFKGDLLGQYKSKIKAKISFNNQKLKLQFLMSIRTFIYALQEILVMVYRIHKIAQEQKQKTFFTEVNIHTFLTSLLFSDQVFYDLVYNIYKSTLKSKIESFESKQYLRNAQISVQYRLDSQTINYFRNYGRFSYSENSNINSLFKPNSQTQQPYYKSLSILQKVFSFKQPILKMKIVYRAALQIQKQINNFYRKNSLDNHKKMLDAQKFLEIVLYIMKKITNENIVADFMIINDFIHDYYKNSKKGCFFTPFLIASDQPFNLNNNSK